MSEDTATAETASHDIALPAGLAEAIAAESRAPACRHSPVTAPRFRKRFPGSC